MIKSINGTTMDIKCSFCSHEYQHQIDLTPVEFDNVFNQYNNYLIEPCPECAAGEAINLNIPTNDTDEPFQTGDLPLQEEIQRHYVRVLQRMIRADFVT